MQIPGFKSITNMMSAASAKAAPFALTGNMNKNQIKFDAFERQPRAGEFTTKSNGSNDSPDNN